jgi:hypothetical protein
LPFWLRSSSARIVAGYVAGLSFEYYDAQDRANAIGTEVRLVAICIKAASLKPDTQIGHIFGIQLDSTIQVLT